MTGGFSMKKIHDCNDDCGCGVLEKLGKYLVSVGAHAAEAPPEVAAKANHWSWWLSVAVTT